MRRGRFSVSGRYEMVDGSMSQVGMRRGTVDYTKMAKNTIDF